MNKFYTLLIFLLLIISILLIINKKYDIFIFYSLFSLIIYYKLYIKEGFNDVSIEQLKKTNDLLDKLIRLFNMNREDCIGEFVPQECNRECGYGMKDEIYNIIQQPGDKGYKCAHKEGKTISNPCLNRLCKSGEFCINNNDCKNNICGEDFRCADIICTSNSVENCNTQDKCESLNNDNSNVLYTWDNNQCNTSFKQYNTTNTNTTNTNTNTTPSQ